jgi:hypothetical protein
MKRLGYAAVGIAATALAIAAVVTQHASWWPLVVFAIAPDISFLAGMSSRLERGRLHPRAVPLYNALHRYWAPAVLFAISGAITGGSGGNQWAASWLAGSLAWIAHISFDRSLGFGLRTPEGFQRT